MKQNNHQEELPMQTQRTPIGIEGFHHTSIPKQIKNIIDLLDRTKFGRKEKDRHWKSYWGLGPINEEIFNSFIQLVKSLPLQLKQVEGIPLVVDATDLQKIPSMLIKKCLVFGETTIMLVGEILKLPIEGRISRIYNPYASGIYHKYGIPEILVSLYEDYESLIRDGLLIPVPSVIINSSEGFEVESIAIPSSIPKKECVKFVADKSSMSRLKNVCNGQIVIPSLNKSRISTIRNFREKEIVSFRRFHRQLKKFLGSGQKANNNDELYNIIRETDYQVRDLDARASIYRRKTALELTGATIGLMSSGILAFGNPTISEGLINFIGASSALAYVKFWSDHVTHVNEQRLENFYFPWKIYRKSLRHRKQDKNLHSSDKTQSELPINE